MINLPLLVEVAPHVWVAQVRAVWQGNDKQTHIRVDDDCTIVTPVDVDTVVTTWTQATR